MNAFLQNMYGTRDMTYTILGVKLVTMSILCTLIICRTEHITVDIESPE